MRYETKFLHSYYNRSELDYIVKTHPSIFKEVFLTRNVNNIYLDTANSDGYRDNIEGFKDRRKARIRWYGDLFGLINNPVLEIKNKNGLLGWKERYPLQNFTLNPDTFFDHKTLFNKIKDKDFINFKEYLNFLNPTLLNRYKRTYYLSYNKKFRLTLDNHMEYYSINPIKDFFVTFTDQEKTIIELKYDQLYRDEAKQITDHFPFRLTKNSKYVTGMDRIRNW